MANKFRINQISDKMRIMAVFALTLWLTVSMSLAGVYAPSPIKVTKNTTVNTSTTTVMQLQAIEDYLNSFRTLKAKFRQINPDGASASGTLYLWRPGRMRLSYDQSHSKNLALQRVIVANGDSFFDHNPQMDETTEIPVDATPASFIMRDRIYFGRDIQVMSNQIRRGMLAITLAKRDDMDMGTLTLFFNPEPLTLLEWEIVDSQQLHTRVILDAIETGVKLDVKLFDTNF